ncbi:hypothetical protein SDC9_191027 [bioreactor metagenome]|uniref:Putative Flp pilus-assembly TadG-like N-terminal domain-containing protein n=2 Tax=root TaxID=1 RepID=A0A645HWT5_9ZZZZ
MAAAIMMMLIAMAGLITDGGIMMYTKIRLEAAADAAAHSTGAAYDAELWEESGIVELDPFVAEQYASILLNENFPEAVLESCEIDPVQKNVATVKARVVVQTVFMKVFGIDNKTIRVTVKNKVS